MTLLVKEYGDGGSGGRDDSSGMHQLGLDSAMSRKGVSEQRTWMVCSQINSATAAREGSPGMADKRQKFGEEVLLR